MRLSEQQGMGEAGDPVEGRGPPGRTPLRPFRGLQQILVATREESRVLGFPSGSAGKESACNAGDLGSIPGLGQNDCWKNHSFDKIDLCQRTNVSAF